MATGKTYLDKEDFAKHCYGLYKLKWLLEHDLSLEDLLVSLEAFTQKEVLDELPEGEFFDYIRYNQNKITGPLGLWEDKNIYYADEHCEHSFGSDNGFWKSFNVFLHTDFTESYRMQRLLGGPDSEAFATWMKYMRPEKAEDETPTNVVYCNRDCVNQKDGYCNDCGVAIDADGYCTGYVKDGDETEDE